MDALRQQLSTITDSRVRDAMLSVPRHLFVPPELRGAAYDDTPLPIGHGQTISQPLMVARMLAAAALDRNARVLDVGCGSGYQAALLHHLAGSVVAIEIIPQLLELARENLRRAGIVGVELVLGNGRLGVPSRAPFDVILVAAASEEVPPKLLEQLADGGRLLIPIGAPASQVLQRWTRLGDHFVAQPLDVCRFVPLVC
jgi:protein-L-isoaspartate(D-aspartate) O-methyltransferase